MSREIWKDIKDYEGLYQVSSNGIIKSLPRTIIKRNGQHQKRQGKILSPSLDRYGYPKVVLHKNNIKKNESIHKLVGVSFLNKKETQNQINHLDGNKLNNNIKNLEWVSAKDNTQHAIKNGLRNPSKGSRNGMAKLNEVQVKEIKDILKNYKRGMYAELARKYNVEDHAISNIRNNITWVHIK